jgi:hypothetical protein
MPAIRDSAGNSAGETVPAKNKNNQTNLDFDKPHRIKVLHGNWTLARWRIFPATTIEAAGLAREQNRLANADANSAAPKSRKPHPPRRIFRPPIPSLRRPSHPPEGKSDETKPRIG